MADEKVVTPEDGTTTTPNQPPVTPDVTPEGTTTPDDLPGTTGEALSEKEQKHQTLYQDLVSRLTTAGIDHKNIGTDVAPASIAAALPGQQDTPATLDPDTPPAEEEPDLYTTEGLKKYFDNGFNQIRGNLNTVVAEALANARAEDKAVANWDNNMKKMDEWLKENKVPQALLDEAVKKYNAGAGQHGTPEFFISTVKGYIKETGQKQNLTAEQQKIINDAIVKATALDALPTTEPGAPPSPITPPGKTAQQEAADDIVKDDDYQFPG
jgi:hypothetical protein